MTAEPKTFANHRSTRPAEDLLQGIEVIDDHFHELSIQKPKFKNTGRVVNGLKALSISRKVITYYGLIFLTTAY